MFIRAHSKTLAISTWAEELLLIVADLIKEKELVLL